MVEAVTAVLYALCVVRFGVGTEVILPLVFVTLLVPVAAIDLEHRIIPGRAGSRTRLPARWSSCWRAANWQCL